MILCLGTTPVYQRSMTFDRVKPDGVNRAKQVADYASGKSLNVARVLHTLGKDPLATGFVGGSRGRMLCGDLDAAGIRHEFVTVKPETRQCITVIDQSAGIATELVEESAPVDEPAWQELDRKLRWLLPQSNLWIFSGTLAPGAPQDFYARWLPLARETGATAILDARGEPLTLALQHGNAIYKLNRDEFAGTLGTDLSDDRTLIDAIRTHTPPDGKLIITLGKSGAIGSDATNVWHVHSPTIQAISAVGSGDAFAAGLGAGLSDGIQLQDALKLAAACGAANALTPFAGHLRPEDVQRLQEQARVESL
ncbi:MAG TPA: hexose kinase [Tepidisphaeraceae bacterium]|jgi:tagatose 6-phosphate kinase